MPQGNKPPHEKSAAERRTPLGNDVDPDGMDSDSEGDELESGPLNEKEEADAGAADGPDGAIGRRSPGQHRTSGTHGAAHLDTEAHRTSRK